MYQQLYELSQYLPQRPIWQRVNEGMEAAYCRGIGLCFDKAGEWKGLYSLSLPEEGHHPEVVYRGGPPNGTNLVPCRKESGKDYVGRLKRDVEVFLDKAALKETQQQWLKKTVASFDRQADAIREAIKAQSKALGVNGKELRLFIFWAEEDGTPVYQWEAAKQLLVERFWDSFRSKGGEREGICAISGKSRAVVGNFSLLACYNLDKPGTIAGGFNENNAHRNFPVSGEVAIALADSVSFANTRLSSSMAGQSYWILPYTNNPEVRDFIVDVLEQRPQRFRLDGAVDLLVDDEVQLLEEFAHCGDQLAYFLTFFEESNAAWRIQAEVQQLLPSRLQALNDARRRVEKMAELSEGGADSIKPPRINAARLKAFCHRSDSLFRSWLTALFEQRTVAYPPFLKQLVITLLNTASKEPKFFIPTVRRAWGVWCYALWTHLIDPPLVKEDAILNEAIPASPLGEYMRRHERFFNRPEIIAAFLTGCYVASVTSVQRKERGASPFERKYLGRTLNKSLLQRLYREGRDKLAQYGKLGYVAQNLDPDLCQAWVACGDRWQINDDETSFAFTLGLSLSYRIAKAAGDEALAAAIDSESNNKEPIHDQAAPK